jgi:hypothetical protein
MNDDRQLHDYSGTFDARRDARIGLSEVSAVYRNCGTADIWVFKDHNFVCHGSNAPDAEQKLRALFAATVAYTKTPEGRRRNGTTRVLECNGRPVQSVGFPMWGDESEVEDYPEVYRGPVGQVQRFRMYSGYYGWTPAVVPDVDPEQALWLKPDWQCYSRDQEVQELRDVSMPPMGLVRDGETWSLLSLRPNAAEVVVKGVSLQEALKRLLHDTEAAAVGWDVIRRRVHPMRACNVAGERGWELRRQHTGSQWAY